MAQPISNTVQNNAGGFPGLLTAPKQQAAAPINFGALNLNASPTPAAVKPATTVPSTPAANGVNYNLPTPTLVNNLVPSSATSSSAPAISQPTQPVTPPANTTGTGGGLVQTAPSNPAVGANGIANNIPGSTGTTAGLFPSVLSSIQGIAQNQTGLGSQAQQIASSYGQQIANAGTEYQKAAAGYATTGTEPVAEGNQNVALNTAANLTNSLTNAGNFALSGVQTGINANTAATNALGTVATAAQPSGTFPFVFNPATGQFTTSTPNGATGTTGAAGAPTLTYNPQTDASTLAGLVIDQKIPYTDALNAMGYAGNVGTGLLQTAIAAQGGNLTNIEAQQSAIQSNIQTSGTAGVQAANTAYNSAVQQVAAATKQYTALTGVSSQLNQTLANWGNTGLITNYNAAVNSIAGVTSNPNYQQFVVALGNTQAAYQSALGSAGVTPSKADVDALTALNPSSSANAINAAINQLSKDAHALLIVPAYQQQQTYAQQLGLQ